ncbi:hypothetical protein ITI46_05030 [Streptomyces oryzae]|uniref:DUF4303 domain-containing protein n=1 Tax=Streptomyces oryzae TaxID=1434886 RepID=A0ABS3X6Q9_9ACTN|nr:hypothetical protein [Streptomyces oryzae]MBO8191063.1 hypothetical protein [Streptomyces oryzae]
MTFRQHLRQMTASALAEFPRRPESTVYAVTFRIDSVIDDCRFHYLALGYNTEEEVARLLAGPSAPEPWEARWNYAYFPPSGLEGVRVIGDHEEHDPRGTELHRQELRAEGLWYEDDDPEHVQDEREELLCTRFHELCVDTARHLHAEGHLVRALGRPVPVLLYNMFDPDAMFSLTEAANPPELVAEFLSEDPDR